MSESGYYTATVETVLIILAIVHQFNNPILIETGDQRILLVFKLRYSSEYGLSLPVEININISPQKTLIRKHIYLNINELHEILNVNNYN